MAIDLVSSSDPRFADLNISKASARWPSPGQSAAAIALCSTSEDVRQAVEQAVKAGMRPTILSGGHCYENFVLDNPGGHIIDVKQLSDITQDPTTKRWKIGAGATVGEMYWGMYSKGGVTIPAASCTTVGVGGHIAGGGYGVLSRLLGNSPDWISAVEIVTVDARRNAHLEIVDRKNKPDLLRACRGSGGGQFGVITAYYSDNPPPAPKEVARVNVRFNWDGMTPERLHRILWLYSNYWDTRGRDKDTWGLFTGFGMNPGNAARNRSPSVGFGGIFTNPDGMVTDTKPLEEFLSIFDECQPISTIVHHPSDPGADHLPNPSGPMEIQCLASVNHNVGKQAWIDSADANYGGTSGAAAAAAQRRGGGGGRRRQKYKSAYMRSPFTLEEARVFHKHLTDTSPYGGATIGINSYGGAINNKEMLHETSDCHRDNIMKLQFITGWTDAAEDAQRIAHVDNFYTDLYSVSSKDAKHKGTPYPNDHTGGCYINYADASLTKYDYWPELYWGTGDLVHFLKRTKKKYDPNNVFHHALSIKA